MELRAEIRRLVLTGEISKRQAGREYSLYRQTLHKLLQQTDPTPFRTKKLRVRPQLDRVLLLIHN